MPKMVIDMRKAIENKYIGVCTVVEYQSVIDDDMTTTEKELIVAENQPCRLSFKTVEKTVQSDTTNALTQSVKLFIAPELEIKPGSKIIVTQAGRTTEYRNSGQPAIYDTHQEIILELYKEWC